MNTSHATNATSMRQSNGRLLLTLLRRHGPQPGAALARLSGLSAQTASVILRDLEAEGLLTRGEPQRGRVGQPSVPMALNPDGAFFLGLKIGRRSNEMLLVDFTGQIRGRRLRRHDWPTPDAALRFAKLAADELIAQLPAALQPRLAGLGIACPFRLWDWPGGSEQAMEAWRTADLRHDLSATLPYPLFLENDASAACEAELVFGKTTLPADIAYAYVGFFAGGGLALDGRLRRGPQGNAGALGSLSVLDRAGQPRQLIDLASTVGLEQRLQGHGLSPDLLWASPDAWDVPEALVADWLADAAQGLSQVALTSTALLDIDAMVIDGWMPAALRTRLLAATEAALKALPAPGITAPRLIEGTLGPDARALGAAALPLAARFLSET